MLSSIKLPRSQTCEHGRGEVACGRLQLLNFWRIRSRPVPDRFRSASLASEKPREVLQYCEHFRARNGAHKICLVCVQERHAIHELMRSHSGLLQGVPLGRFQ